MEVILLGIYSFFVWLIFIKLKWLPWNTGTQVVVVIIPIVGLAALILLLNIFAPSSSDVRVYTYTVPIVSQVRGRVVEVPVHHRPRRFGRSKFGIRNRALRGFVDLLAVRWMLRRALRYRAREVERPVAASERRD